MTAQPIPADAPALVVRGIGDVALERRPVRRPGPGEVLIEVAYSGVSIGTELWGATGKAPVWGPPPFVPGYQAVGRVVALGEHDEAPGFEVGDHVASFVVGSHQRYAVATGSRTHRLNSTDRLHQAALFVQPAVGANALNMARVGGGDTVLVVGQGLIGQATALLARHRGAYVIGTDVSPERLALSAAHCVDWAVDVSDTPASEQIADRFPDGVDIVIESTGFVQLVDDAMRCARSRGTFVFEGYYPDGLSFEFRTPHTKQLTAVFPWFIGEPPQREAILRLITSGVLDLDPLISDRIPWTASAALYERLFTPERDSFNGVVFDWRDAT